MRGHLAVLALAFSLCGCKTLMTPTGGTVTGPDGIVREETVADTILAPIAGVASAASRNPMVGYGVALLGALGIGAAMKKKKPAGGSPAP
jgi:hypothetical protein